MNWGIYLGVWILRIVDVGFVIVLVELKFRIRNGVVGNKGIEICCMFGYVDWGVYICNFSVDVRVLKILDEKNLDDYVLVF